jgi:DNA-binding NarL/FixJ family response regulator
LTLKILIADDHDLIRTGLRARLEMQEGWTVCGEARTGVEAVKMARALKPDVAVLDISMPELNGLEAARQIRHACPQTEVLIVTMQESDGLVREVLDAGVRGFIFKTDPWQMLVAAVEALAEHEPFFTGKVSKMVLGGFLDPARAVRDPHRAGSRLSAREREVAQLIAEGRTAKEVASLLGVSVKTVEAHRANLMARLQFHSVTELVRYCIREKIIEA